ncbi:hypothetical protein [Marivita sp. XM-24bin2]|jgi:hypothetical protein|uniref:hypothetical protein n=1 Tax=unclassified Marivita TaxID=2632480 RepID=UPI0025B7DF5E|nr:hypothetical protein [Marivita sp. XM-24bin2]MCR9109787.1 hypothetical protein [Paracoccaceae bacterium]
MTAEFIVPLLALMTMLTFIVFALVSKQRTEEERADPNAPKSRLAEDAPNS